MDYIQDNWPQIRERYEAFWRGEIIDRPLMQVTADRPDGPPPVEEDTPPIADPDALLDWFVNADKVIPRIEREAARKHYAGDAFPYTFPVSPSLVAIQAAYLGGRYSISPDNLSGWCDPIIDRWDDRRPLVVDEDNLWWKSSVRLLVEGAKAAAGRLVVGIPDLQGGPQILDLLRGTENLCLDLLENPREVKPALDEIHETWVHYWNVCNDCILPYQDGYCDWLRVWSDRSVVTAECDFSVMISSAMFEEFALPYIEKQTASIERSIYHLDGSGAVRHLEMLLALESLDAVQWEPEGGPPDTPRSIPMFQHIQDSGKLLVLACLPSDVTLLLSELRPEGVFIRTHCETPEEADILIERVTKLHGR